MFNDPFILLVEMAILLILAAALGVLVGWILFGGKKAGSTADVMKLKAELNACKEELARTRRTKSALPPPKKAKEEILDYGGDSVFEGAVPEGGNIGLKPVSLSAPNGGIADDLKLIKGIGVQMEALCNKLGFYHFDQIASWSVEEVAWVDNNLEGFKGRATRDNWVSQARVLAAGGNTEYSAKMRNEDQ